MKSILVAGIGNIFLGDDAFGVEVAHELSRLKLPQEVEVKDFGIRGYDLATALAKGYDAAILVDATSRSETPGTVFLIQPDVASIKGTDTASMDGHSLDPMRVLQMAESFGGCPEQLYVVGCEPADLGGEDGRMGLSDAVQSAVPTAMEMIQSLIEEILQPQGKLRVDVAAA